jgi:hypothetical protein
MNIMVPFKYARNRRIHTKKIPRSIFRHPFYACCVLLFVTAVVLNTVRMFRFVGIRNDINRINNDDNIPMQIQMQIQAQQLHADNGRRNTERAIFSFQKTTNQRKNMLFKSLMSNYSIITPHRILFVLMFRYIIL